MTTSTSSSATIDTTSPEDEQRTEAAYLASLPPEARNHQTALDRANALAQAGVSDEEATGTVHTSWCPDHEESGSDSPGDRTGWCSAHLYDGLRVRAIDIAEVGVPQIVVDEEPMSLDEARQMAAAIMQAVRVVEAAS